MITNAQHANKRMMSLFRFPLPIQKLYVRIAKKRIPNACYLLPPFLQREVPIIAEIPATHHRDSHELVDPVVTGLSQKTNNLFNK